MSKRTQPRGQLNNASLKLRVPEEDVVAIKIAAAMARMTISEYMLSLFHDRMKRRAS